MDAAEGRREPGRVGEGVDVYGIRRYEDKRCWVEGRPRRRKEVLFCLRNVTRGKANWVNLWDIPHGHKWTEITNARMRFELWTWLCFFQML